MRRLEIELGFFFVRLRAVPGKIPLWVAVHVTYFISKFGPATARPTWHPVADAVCHFAQAVRKKALILGNRLVAGVGRCGSVLVPPCRRLLPKTVNVGLGWWREVRLRWI